MEGLKKLIGLLSMVAGLAFVYYLVSSVMNGTLIKDPLQNKIFALVVLPVLVPIVIGGLGVFGYYALKGEYEGSHLPTKDI